MYGLLRGCGCVLTPSQRREWRGFLCGVCESLRQGFGSLARLLSNHDAAFLSLLHEAQLPPRIEIPRVKPRCLLTSQARRMVPDPRSEGSRFARDVAVLSARAKLEDAVADGDRSWLRLPGLRAYVRSRALLARREMGELRFDANAIEGPLRAHPLVESQSRSLDDRLRPVEEAYAAVFEDTARLSGATANTAALRGMGAAFGRLTYLCDAAADLREDRLRGRANLLADCFAFDRVKAEFPPLARETWERLCEALCKVKLNRHEELLWALAGKGLFCKTEGEKRIVLRPKTPPPPPTPESPKPPRRPLCDLAKEESCCLDVCFCCCQCCT